MSVLDQSVAFAAVSDTAVFIFTNAGLTTGAGSEVGAILGDFNLRRENPEPDRKPRQRIGLFLHRTSTVPASTRCRIPTISRRETSIPKITFQALSKAF